MSGRDPPEDSEESEDELDDAGFEDAFPVDDDPGDEPEDAAGTGEGSDEPAGREGPLGDLAEEINRRREEERPPQEDLFEEADVEGVDREALWRQVAGESAAERVEVEPETGEGPRVERPEGTADAGAPGDEERAIRVVEKRSYCQGCEHFSAPPDVHCTHEGTDILEAVDMEHFRVADCPVVAEDEELENV